MKYTFKCPHCGCSTLAAVEDVLAATEVDAVFKSDEHSIEDIEYGESTRDGDSEVHGYKCRGCHYRWETIEAVDEAGGLVPDEEERA